LSVTAAKVCQAAITDSKSDEIVALRATNAAILTLRNQDFPFFQMLYPPIQATKKLAQGLLKRFHVGFE